MQLEDYFDFVGSDASDPSSSQSIRIKGHRIGIEHVLAYYHEGYTPDEIVAEFPGLGLEKVYAAITYYLHNRPAVDIYLNHLKGRSERAYNRWVTQSSAVVQRLRESQSDYPEQS
jgi:uncharacterized protein (DUF433 family)